MSPRWYDAPDRRIPGAGHRRRAAGPPLGDGPGRTWWTSATSRLPASASRSTCPGRANLPEVELEWTIPRWSNTLERDRARTYFQAYAAAAALYFLDRAMREVYAGRTRTSDRVHGARGGDRLRLPRGRARRAVAPRGDPRRQDRQLPPLSADLLERQPSRLLRHARPLRGRGPGHADLRGERAGPIQGHRHHADGPELRPLPAVRRPHVPGGRQDGPRATRADVRSPGRSGAHLS